MSKTKDEFMKQQFTGSLDQMGDEDYLYEQYLMQEKMNEEYWEYVSISENQEQYIPTPEEEQENYNQTKQNGHT
jgi:hypothetical protein